MFNHHGQGEAGEEKLLCDMEIDERHILNLVTTELTFMNELKQPLVVTSILPFFIYLHNPLDEKDFDTNFEFVAKLNFSNSKSAIRRICCWYNKTKQILYNKALVMPSNISYIRVNVVGKDILYGGYILNEQLECILKSDEFSQRDVLWREAKNVTSRYSENNCPSKCTLYDSNLKKCLTISFD